MLTSLVTNLTRDEFDLNELKKMYHMRWNIETAFKMLKYIIGMMSFHSKKRNFIQQEIYAAILLHCLTNIITERIEVEQSDKRKHHYKVNLSTAVTNMRLWLRKIICTKEMIKRIKKYLAPVRPDRKYEYIKLDRDKSTFKSHRDFSSEIEITFKHF